MLRRHAPIAGIAIAGCLFLFAAWRYPGGTTESAQTVGFDWTRNYISSLFAPVALNGAPNGARAVAIPAMVVLCLGVALIFHELATRATASGRKTAIRIGGLGSMVYASLAVTPMHDLMINIALPFALVAIVALLLELRATGQPRLVACGVASLAAQLFTALIYYGGVLPGWLAVMQKASMVALVGWLLAAHYATERSAPRSATANESP